MSDSLATAERRLRLPGYLAQGIPLVNRLLGLRIPSPASRPGQADALANDAQATADIAFGQLFGMLLGVPVEAEADWWPHLSRLRGMLDPSLAIDPLPATRTHADAAAALSQEALVQRIRDDLSVRRIDFDEAFASAGLVYVKVNHYHWEYLSWLAQTARGEPPFRRLRQSDIDEWRLSGIDELFIQTLQRQDESLRRNGHAAGDFDADGFSFGIGFQNGDGHLSDDLVLPVPPQYWPLYRGAMCGSLAFFDTFFPAPHYRFSDGGFPKMLIWERRIDDFFAAAQRAAEAIVFVVPDPLRDIYVRRRDGITETLVVPATRVHELWPVVLPVIVAQLAELFARHRSVCILVQAAFMSVPIGIAVNLLRAEFPDTRVWFFDMGQALDVAMFPHRTAGPWLRQPDIQGMLRAAGEFPIGLRGL